jgi:hypothetical protein
VIEIATFETAGGAALVLFQGESDLYPTVCHGCAESKTLPEPQARNWADLHADRCRAVARY